MGWSQIWGAAEDAAATAISPLLTASGLGLETTVQPIPFQRSIKVWRSVSVL
jgi:hypothetical protein